MTDQPRTTASAAWPLLALAIGSFGIGTSEFTPMGLLPVIAAGVHVSIPGAGMLITAYAVGVMLGAPVMTLLLSPYRRRTALVLLMGIFTLGNLFSALAPGFAALFAARVFTSLCHGAFFGLGALVAASLVPAHKQASALATVFLGLTIANIGGVPAATWLGQQIGWRPAFLATAGLGVLAMLCLLSALPRGEAGKRPEIARELRVLTHPSVLTAMATTVMGSAAMFTLYTYIAPVLTHLAGASDGFVTLCLVLVGLGFTVGNMLGGRLADWSLDRATGLFMAALAVVMILLPFAFASHLGAAAGVFLWGVATFAIIPPVQMRVMQAAADAPGLASSINIGAFNLGNALGAALGGGVISAGFGYGAIPVAGGLMALLGLGFVLLGRRAAAAPGALAR